MLLPVECLIIIAFVQINILHSSASKWNKNLKYESDMNLKITFIMMMNHILQPSSTLQIGTCHQMQNKFPIAESSR